LFEHVRRLWEQKPGPWANVIAIAAFLHPDAPFVPGKWRSHLHMILVLDGTPKGPLASWFANELHLRDVGSDNAGIVGKVGRTDWYLEAIRNYGDTHEQLLAQLWMLPENRVFNAVVYGLQADHVEGAEAVAALVALDGVHRIRKWGLFYKQSKHAINAASRELLTLMHGGSLAIIDNKVTPAKELVERDASNPGYVAWLAKRERMKEEKIAEKLAELERNKRRSAARAAEGHTPTASNPKLSLKETARQSTRDAEIAKQSKLERSRRVHQSLSRSTRYSAVRFA
jgi:hypothetical protein